LDDLLHGDRVRAHRGLSHVVDASPVGAGAAAAGAAGTAS
jgi:hypothetical protein